MKRLTTTVMAIGISSALLATGALAPFRGETSQPAAPLGSQARAALLGPSIDTESLDAIVSSLRSNVARDPADWRSHAYLGLAYLQKSRIEADPAQYPRAEAALRRSLELRHHGNFQALLGMGILAAARHDFAGALHWSRRAKEANELNADIRGVMVDALIELGRYGAAARELDAMMRLRPDLSAYARVSYYRELLGDTRGAARAMRLARDAAGSPVDAAWSSSQLGDLYFNQGELRVARRHYRRALFLSPGDPAARTGLAEIEAAHGHLRRATRIARAVAEDSATGDSVVLLGELYQLQGRTGLAARQYERFHDFQELEAGFGVQTELDTAVFDVDHGFDRRRALVDAKIGYGTRPSVVGADAFAWTLYRNGRYRAARTYARKALRLGTRDATFEFHAGMIELKLGHRRAARAHLSRALSINPHFSILHSATARRTLRRLQGPHG